MNGKNRTEETIKLFQFKSPDERVKADIHCLAITSIDLLLISKKIKESKPNLSVKDIVKEYEKVISSIDKIKSDDEYRNQIYHELKTVYPTDLIDFLQTLQSENYNLQ